MKKRYYPKDKRGNYDEWHVVVSSQIDAADRAEKAKFQQKRDKMVN